jgi:hypothetical protein
MRRILSLCTATIAIGACVSLTGVHKIGPDTYTITTHASGKRGGAVTARSMALDEANQFCTNQGQEILVKNAKQETARGNLELIFRCLSAGDPELAERPEYNSSQDKRFQTQTLK